MNTLSTHFRRLVTSVMLVAMTSFVLHSGALAGMHRHGLGASDCQPMASTAHGHQHGAEAHVHQAAHAHGDGVGHHHAQVEAADESASDNQPAKASLEGPCCSSACPVAMAPLGLDPISAPMGIAVALLPMSQNGSGMSLDGLKRPPRPPSIA
ncbi:hypothetical protein ILT44_23725 [Microvirga sp. BT689]|uniref:hypothetical protein n=1 Tax=Microvirga arvi TaxID=2778731 RepID=UPI001950E7E0|nr:hypothetical protein [Microvirga arvi]MBM6583215.1 hypothetical protein [Microvirga arvi]